MHPTDTERLYIKLRSRPEDETGGAYYHVHVDARKALAESTIAHLLEAGFFHDFFDHDYRLYGRGGDPDVPFPSFAPLVHFTFLTADVNEYRNRWHIAREAVLRSGTPCYLEGELVIADVKLRAKAFDEEEYERVVPRTDGTCRNVFAYVSAIDGARRLRPAAIDLRRLDPVRNGPRDRFRIGEVHLSLRHDAHPKVLDLLCNLGFAAPAIPKLVEGVDGALERDDSGRLRIIHDLPLTLQAMNMRDVLRVTELALNVIGRVGGVVEGSAKIERAINFELFNGVDYSEGVPPVIAEMIFRDDFKGLGSIARDAIGEALQLTRAAATQAAHRPRLEKKVRFESVWNTTRAMDGGADGC